MIFQVSSCNFSRFSCFFINVFFSKVDDVSINRVNRRIDDDVIDKNEMKIENDVVDDDVLFNDDAIVICRARSLNRFLFRSITTRRNLLRF